MTYEQTERLICALEAIAAKLASPPQLPQFYPAIMPRADCGCPSPGVCMTVSCPRQHMSLGIRTAAANP